MKELLDEARDYLDSPQAAKVFRLRPQFVRVSEVSENGSVRFCLFFYCNSTVIIT